jgi:uncharacterized damage-inducible protein DinB
MPQQEAVQAPRSSSNTGRSERQRFLAMYERESATTRKVLAAYPSAQCELKPHDRSNSAKKLAATFVVEQRMILKALKHEQVLGGGWPKTTDTWEELLAEFDATRDEILRQLRTAGDEALDGTITFFVAPKQTGEYSTADFVTFMAHDQIHHRGQLSVYLRMAGAKVPSIYGPSADEPWN